MSYDKLLLLIIFISLCLIYLYRNNANNSNSDNNGNSNSNSNSNRDQQQGGNDYCQNGETLVDAERPCDMGTGMNILTYLGLGPADQDQLNIINHKDHNNLAWILRRPLSPPRKLINNLQPSNTGPSHGMFSADSFGKVDFKTWNPCNCDIGIVNLDRPPTMLEGVTDAVAERLVDGETHNMLYNLSPSFMRTGIKQYYGSLYYNDVRYPERPISIEFADNPAEYCLKHPQEYPCPLIASRKDIR